MALRAKKYFKDYKVEEQVSDNGKVKRTYVYCGDWYVRQLSGDRRLAERIFYVLAGMVAAVLLVFAMLIKVSLNSAGIFAGITILALVPAFLVLEGSVEAFFKKGNLKKEQYQERVIMLKAMPCLGAALNLAVAIAYAVRLAGQGYVAEQAGNTKGLILTAINVLLYAAIAVNEFLVKYEIIKGVAEANVGSAMEREDIPKYYD